MKSVTIGILILCLSAIVRIEKQQIVLKKYQLSRGIHKDQPVFKIVDQYAEFPGGMNKFYQYLSRQLQLTPKENFGRIICRFIIEANGKINDVRIVKGLGKSIDMAVIKIIRNSPNWRPGIRNGKAVRQEYTLPIIIDPQD